VANKGHQLEDGKIFAHGDYKGEDMTCFEQEVGCNHPIIKATFDEYQCFLEELRHTNSGDNARFRSTAVRNQRKILRKYSDIWNVPHSLSSHSTCLSCLFATPCHVLPCGHVLCDVCADDFSDATGLSRTITRCPLCTDLNEVVTPWILERVPRQAAPRVLSLDGYACNVFQPFK